MNIQPQHLKSAFGSLLPQEQDAVLLSDTKPASRTGLTKFSAALLAELLPQCGASLTVRAAFKGNLSGRSGGASGGLQAVTNFAMQAVSATNNTFLEEEHLVDFLVTEDDPIHVAMSVESEARPIASPDDLHDFNKLLLVSSPRRLFVSRVNITKTGKLHKLEAAIEALAARFAIAVERNHVAPDAHLAVVLVQTSVDKTRVAHVAQCRGDGSLHFTELAFS